MRTFEIPSLPYDYDALEPYIDKETMEIHHSMHHAGYTRKFNDALQKQGLDIKTARDVLINASLYDSALVNNGGGYFNHKLFWKFLSPNGGGEPQGDLKDIIVRDFGSFGNFKDKLSTAAKTHFGSGWAWLILQKNKLQITTTLNQDSPFMDTLPSKERGFPLLGIDVWEHAYYLKYQNRRAEYVEAFWNIVNWETVLERLSKGKKFSF
ncbi:MAG: superoxide dismutase [Bacteroidales bacterium]|nr:superoxide dismutase [Bacteroidales bacterium]